MSASRAMVHLALGIVGIAAATLGQAAPNELRARAAVALANRAAQFANLHATMEWRDDHREWTNRCVMKFRAPGQLALDFGHDSSHGDWRHDWNRRRFYLLDNRYSSIELGDRLYGEKTLSSADELPATIMICPWFILTGWWPEGLFGRAGGLWRDRAIDLRELVADPNYTLFELADGRTRLLSSDGLDELILDPARDFCITSRRIRGAEDGSEATLVVDSCAQLESGTWIPQGFRFEAVAGSSEPALRGRVTEVRFGATTPDDFARTELQRGGTARVDAFGAFDRQVVPGGHDLLDAFAANVTSSPLVVSSGAAGNVKAFAAGVVAALLAGLVFFWRRPRAAAAPELVAG